ncbi:MAG TPA: hypothetical protein VJM82_05530 [Nitrospiraceae bacterium]|nr:hypothetical protein [Nitrospiraceae bacterium]
MKRNPDRVERAGREQGRLGTQCGATYLFAMFTIVVMGLTLSLAAKQWKMVVQREQEADLLAKGIEIQTALQAYSTAMKAGRVIPGEVYPLTLAELTKPPKPFLRKPYKDPVGRGDWEYLRAPNGGIRGVRSRSTAAPIKKRDFPLAVRHFEGLPRYSDWVFQYPNASMASPVPQVPGGVAAGGAPSNVPPSPNPLLPPPPSTNLPPGPT